MLGKMALWAVGEGGAALRDKDYSKISGESSSINRGHAMGKRSSQTGRGRIRSVDRRRLGRTQFGGVAACSRV
jgi:hypothetical protein